MVGPAIRSMQVAVFVLVSGAVVPAGGQSPDSQARVSIAQRPRREPQPISHANFKLDVKLVLTPVTVRDLLDRPIVGLKQSAFRVFEDDVEQWVTTFSMSDAPVSVGLVFDSSASMKNRIADSRAAVEQFLRTASPEDEFFLVRFNDQAQLVTSFTRDIDEISRRLSLIRPTGRTAMIDAICRSLHEMRRATNSRRALLVLSDGGDNSSRYSESELLSLVRESDVRVYAIGLFERPGYLKRLAEETGGRMIWVRHLNELSDAIERLSVQIRSEYVLGYFSNQTQNDGRYHRVRIEVHPPVGTAQVRASWRRGYFAPGD